MSVTSPCSNDVNIDTMPDFDADKDASEPTEDAPASIFDPNKDDPADLLEDVFGIHHLVWLYRNEYIHDAPYELGPFPATMDFMGTGKFDEKIKQHLLQWGIITTDGELHPDARFLFETLLGRYKWALWGSVLLHSMKTNARETFDPKGDDEWGLKHAVRDVPRVPLMIAVTDREIVTAINAPPQLVLNRIPRIGNVYKQVGSLLKGILDPEGNWSPWAGPRVSIPMRAANQIAENKDISRLTDDDDARREQAIEVKKALRAMEFSSNTVEKFTELAGYPTAASLSANINYPSSSGMVSPSVALGVTFFDGAGVVVSYPVGRTDETRTLYYVPGDEAGFAAGVEAMVQAAEYAEEDRR